MIITAFNPTTEDLEKTYLANAISAGTTNLTVKNNDNFAANSRIMIGEMGQEKTEIVTVSSISGGTAMVVGATVFPHEADTPIYELRFDQVKFYRSTGGINGTYSILATEDMDVDNAELQTLYDDTTGDNGYYYKVSFYHSIAAIESSLTDPIAGLGWRRRQVGYVIDQILSEVQDQNEQIVTRTEVLGYFNDVNDDLQLNQRRPYDFLHTRSALARTANRNYIDFPTNSSGEQTMWKFDRMDYNYVDSTTTPVTDRTYTLNVIPIEEFENKYQDNTIDSTTVDDEAQDLALDTAVNRFRYYPPSATTSGAVFYLYYWKFFDEINSEGDEIETPTPKIYKLYSKAMYYNKRAVTEPQYQNKADRLMADYIVEKNMYQMHNRKDAGTPRSMRRETGTFRSFRRR